MAELHEQNKRPKAKEKIPSRRTKPHVEVISENNQKRLRSLKFSSLGLCF